MRCEQERVLKDGETEGHENVDPEGDGHTGDDPSAHRVVCLVGFHHILLSASDDGRNREEEGPQKERLSLVGYGLLECAWKLGKAKGHAGTETGKEDEIDNVEDGPDGDQTRKSMWLDRYQG